MYSLDAARQLFAFDRWSNDRMIVALNQVDEPSDELRAIAWHIFAAIENWSSRIDGSQPRVDLEWGPRSVEEITALSGSAHAHITDILDRINETALRARFESQNTEGKRFYQRVDEVLLHLALHGAEHRGQCWLLIGQQGGPADAPSEAWYRLGRQEEGEA